MEKKHPLNDLIQTTMENIRTVADANTIIGAPIQADGVTLIPVSRLSVGVAGGGTEFSTKKQTAPEQNFGGGSGASAKLEPVAFLIIRDGNVKLLPVSHHPVNTMDRIVDTIPEVVDKVTGYLENQKAKKEAAQPSPVITHSDFAE